MNAVTKFGAVIAATLLAACPSESTPPEGRVVVISGALKAADQPQGGDFGTGERASSGLAIVALDTTGRTIEAPISEAGTFSLEVTPHTSYTLNLLDTNAGVYIGSFLYRTGASVDLALTIGETDIALGNCQSLNGEIWCDGGFFDATDSPVEPPRDMYGRLRATIHATGAASEVVIGLLGGTVIEYDLAPNPLNAYHVALSRHDIDGQTCREALRGTAEKIGDERYLYTDLSYANDTCNATARFQVSCKKDDSGDCHGFLRIDIVSTGSDCSAYPATHVAEPVTIEVIEPGVVTCPLPETCTRHSDCESAVCDMDVGFCDDRSTAESLRIFVFDVGNGQSVLAITPSGKSILIDAGRAQNGRMISAMVRRMVPRLDMMILSHFDADHAGGAVPFMLGPDGYPGLRGVDDDRLNGVDDEGEVGAPGSDDLLPIEVLDRGITPMPSGFEDYVSILGARRHEAIAGEEYDFGDGVTMQILTVNGRIAGVPGLAVDEENARSVGVIFRYGEFSMTNLGDLPAGGLGTERLEQLIIPAVFDDIPVDVHFLSHHGSKASSPPELIKSLRPRVAVISVGDSDRCGAGFNSYGLPAQEVLDAVHEAGTVQRIYQSEEGGASFSGNCIPNGNQLYPRDYGETPVSHAYSVFTIEAYGDDFRVSGLAFNDHYEASGCSGDACATCPLGYIDDPEGGDRCIIDPCLPDPCNSRGLCDFIGVGQFLCTCEPHFTGDLCESCEPAYVGANCDSCADGFIAHPTEGETCIDDPCAPDACSGRGECSVTELGLAACACSSNYAGAACDACVVGYDGVGCNECAEGYVVDPTSAGRCIADPCLDTPCGAHGACAVTGPAAFVCECDARWAGQLCDACAVGYAGAACDTCATGFVVDPTAPETCIADLCEAAPCGNRGACAMASAGVTTCECFGNFAGETCGACIEGYAGATCEDCAGDAHDEDGICAPNRTFAGCALTEPTIWTEAGIANAVEVEVTVTGGEDSGGRVSGVEVELCWADTAVWLPLIWEDLACAPATYAGDRDEADVYGLSVVFPDADRYSVVARVSGDGGATWIACDADGIVGGNLNATIVHAFNIANGGFEVMDGPLTDWEADLGVDVEAETEVVHSGQRAVRLTRTTTVNGDTDFISAAFPVVGGSDYTISMWFFDNDASARANVIYAFFDATDTQLGSTSFGGSYSSDSDVWQNTTRTVTAPAGSASIRVSTRVYSQSGGASTGGSVVIDDVSVIPE